jgi:hypothetical protein
VGDRSNGLADVVSIRIGALLLAVPMHLVPQQDSPVAGVLAMVRATAVDDNGAIVPKHVLLLADSLVHLHIAINSHGHKLVGFNVLKLHDLMPRPRKLAPLGRLLRVLL